MEYRGVAEVARMWGVSERSVRNYCAQGRVPGAVLDGKTWRIPLTAGKPGRANAARGASSGRDGFDDLPLAGEPAAGSHLEAATLSPLLGTLLEQQRTNAPGGIYHKVQVDLTYNSNHMEGSRLTHDQTRWIFETATIGVDEQPVSVDDIIETVNHFRCVDHIIAHALDPLEPGFIKELHAMLKAGTTDSRTSWFAVGDYKRLPNEVGGRQTTHPRDVARAVERLVGDYEAAVRDRPVGIEELAAFHVRFERIHPFQDGNGRVGRLVLFKECLRHGIVPFIIEDDFKLFYYRGLKEWDVAPGFLTDTFLAAQDRFKAALDYFEIAYL